MVNATIDNPAIQVPIFDGESLTVQTNSDEGIVIEDNLPSAVQNKAGADDVVAVREDGYIAFIDGAATVYLVNDQGGTEFRINDGHTYNAVCFDQSSANSGDLIAVTETSSIVRIKPDQTTTEIATDINGSTVRGSTVRVNPNDGNIHAMNTEGRVEEFQPDGTSVAVAQVGDSFNRDSEGGASNYVRLDPTNGDALCMRGVTGFSSNDAHRVERMEKGTGITSGRVDNDTTSQNTLGVLPDGSFVFNNGATLELYNPDGTSTGNTYEMGSSDYEVAGTPSNRVVVPEQGDNEVVILDGDDLSTVAKVPKVLGGSSATATNSFAPENGLVAVWRQAISDIYLYDTEVYPGTGSRAYKANAYLNSTTTLEVDNVPLDASELQGLVFKENTTFEAVGGDALLTGFEVSS